MPHVPFGSRVLGHIPLEKQTKLGGRSFSAYPVVLAPNVKGGHLLFNVQSGWVVIRRTFTVLGPYKYEFGVIKSMETWYEEMMKNFVTIQLSLSHSDVQYEY